MNPLHLWNLSVGIHRMRPLPDPEDLAVATSKVEYRTVQIYGIEFLGLKYNSARLAAFRARPNAPRHVRIAVSRTDLRSIMFLEPEDGQFHEVPIHPALLPRVVGITLERHKMARAMQLACPAQLGGEEGIFRAYALLDDEMRKLSGADGLAGRRKAARQWEALQKAKPPEEPPAFDVGASGDSVLGDILERLGRGTAEPPEEGWSDDGEGSEAVASEPIGKAPEPPKVKRERKSDAPAAALPSAPPDWQPEAPFHDDLDDLAPLPVSIRNAR